jgi:hypothetical protein
MSVSKRARLLPDLLTARKATPASRFTASSVTEAETAAPPKARLRAKLVADLVQSHRRGNPAHEAPAGANDEAAQNDPDVLYRKGDASATGFQPESWTYEPPSAHGDETVVCPHATLDTSDQKVSSEAPTFAPTQSNLLGSVSSSETGVENESRGAADTRIPDASLPVASAAWISRTGSEAAAQSQASAAITDHLREELSPDTAHTLHGSDQTAIARPPDPATNELLPTAASEPITGPTNEIIPSSAGSHALPDHTAVASVLRLCVEKAAQISDPEAIAISDDVSPTQTPTVPLALDQAAIARLLEPIRRDPDASSQLAQLLDHESQALAISPAVPGTLANEAAKRSHGTIEIAPPERAMLVGPIDLAPNSAELGPSCYSGSIEIEALTNTSAITTEPFADSPAEESISADGKMFADLGIVIESVLTQRRYGSPRPSPDHHIRRDSLDAKAAFSDSLLNELHAAKGSETALPERHSPFPFWTVAAIALIAALIGCATWEGLFNVLVERLG